MWKKYEIQSNIVQKGWQNKQGLAVKLNNKIQISYRIYDHYFKEERIQKLDLNFISLSWMIPKEY